MVASNVHTYHPAGTVDLKPTIMEIIGVVPPQGWPLDGTSLLPLITGQVVNRTKPMGFVWGMVFGNSNHTGVCGSWLDEQRVLGNARKSNLCLLCFPPRICPRTLMGRQPAALCFMLTRTPLMTSSHFKGQCRVNAHRTSALGYHTGGFNQHRARCAGDRHRQPSSVDGAGLQALWLQQSERGPASILPVRFEARSR